MCVCVCARNKFCYSIIEPHHPLIFSFKLFFSLLSTKKKKKTKNNKNKNLFFSLLIQTYSYTFSNLSHPSLPLYLPTTLYFTVTLPSSFPLSYNLTLLLPILFCINLTSFLSFNPYFFHTQKLWVYILSLSLSLSLSW